MKLALKFNLWHQGVKWSIHNPFLYIMNMFLSFLNGLIFLNYFSQWLSLIFHSWYVLVSFFINTPSYTFHNHIWDFLYACTSICWLIKFIFAINNPRWISQPLDFFIKMSFINLWWFKGMMLDIFHYCSYVRPYI